MIKADCPNRCDIDTTYNWNHTNSNQNFIIGNIPYTLKTGDTISLTTRIITPDKIVVQFNNNELELVKGESNDTITKWSGTIPGDWNGTEIFNVIAIKGSCKMLLYEGLLNTIGCTSVSSVPASFIADSVTGITHTLSWITQAKYDELKENNMLDTNTYYTIVDDDSYDEIQQKLKDLSKRIDDLEKKDPSGHGGE